MKKVLWEIWCPCCGVVDTYKGLPDERGGPLYGKNCHLCGGYTQHFTTSSKGEVVKKEVSS